MKDEAAEATISAGSAGRTQLSVVKVEGDALREVSFDSRSSVLANVVQKMKLGLLSST